jgi:hypothetical protein
VTVSVDRIGLSAALFGQARFGHINPSKATTSQRLGRVPLIGYACERRQHSE